MNRLSPKDTNYLQSFTRFNNLVSATLPLNINSTNAQNAVATVPSTVSTFGDGQVFLDGAVQVTAGSPTANLKIASLPSPYAPLYEQTRPVSVLRSGAFVNNALEVSSGQSGAVSGVTITSAGLYATLPTLATAGPGNSATITPVMGAYNPTIVAAGTGYVPGSTVTLTGGTETSAAVLNVATTGVVSATIAAAGSGGTNGTQTVTGTTGTGTHFQASVTVTLGAITAVLSITVAGSYTVNPTTIANEPVTGAGLTGAALSVVMGIATVTVSSRGSYTVLPTSPIASTGSGTGATFSMIWGLVGATVSAGGYGYTSASTLTVSGGGGSGGGSGSLIVLLIPAGSIYLVNAPQTNDVVYLGGTSLFVKSYN